MIDLIVIRALIRAGKNADTLLHLYDLVDKGVKESLIIGEGPQKLDFIIPLIEERMLKDLVLTHKVLKEEKTE